ncbi:MAG: hypothetical protein IAF02_15915 [Anaerolineae bacterium]|nr:hypothetical protein [Anaerolineae bacterium]
MTTKEIESLLDQALLHNGDMQYELYENELEKLLDDLRTSLKQDKEDYIFVVTENSGHVAMVLIENSGKFYINEKARDELKKLWLTSYENNLKQLIPMFALQLVNGELAVTGVSVSK